MILWLVLALMTAAAVLAVLWPLARRTPVLQSGSDVAVYRDQLEEIERDRAAGRIRDTEAEAAHVEVSRRLIAAADAAAMEQSAGNAAAAMWRRRAVAVVALVALPLGAAGLYLAVGSPFLPGQPLTARTDEQPSINTLVARVESHLARNPNDGRGWEVIAPVYLGLGRFDDAVKALRNALALNGETAARLSGLGEALVMAENGVVTAEAKAMFERASALDAEDVKSAYYLGLAAEQDGRAAEAVARWRAILQRAPADAPWAEGIRKDIARVQGGPTEDMIASAADLAPEQRAAMIQGMVARLAERLQRDGSDLEGWLQLVRSYMVLGDRDKAKAAAADARRSLATEPEKLRRIEELLKGIGLDG